MSGILLPSKCCCEKKPFTCNSPGIGGCAACSCCGSRYYLVCITGATGPAAVINNNDPGWTVTNGGEGGTYSFENANVKVVLELYTEWIVWIPEYWEEWGPYCREWILKVYYKSEGDWVEGLSVAGRDYTSSDYIWLDRNCSMSQIKNGIRFVIRPKEAWIPSKFRLTISGHTICAANCTGSGYNYFRYRVHYANLDGVYELPSVPHNLGPAICDYGLDGVGSYSYSIYNTGDCSGTPYKTITGKFNILIRQDALRYRVAVLQDTYDNAVRGYDFYSSSEQLTPEQLCRGLVLTNQVNPPNSNNCPEAWGYYDTAWVRTGHNATATLVGIM